MALQSGEELDVTAADDDDGATSGGRKAKTKPEPVSLMTIHAAKGLEFDCVFVCGCIDGVLPSAWTTSQSDIEEERRLFYVAVTRAKEVLFITSVREYVNIYGQKRAGETSRFLEGPKTLPRSVYAQIYR